ncbi:unnamed protein product [Cylicocyclus nassatus]|uniref:Uncharacterized protein n=1 Tax=Cylicocyclus nassatus TaxID=53992 RepID=A0AA36DS12_CYLNA|nr:unnamed protein product [Cylicocyclus nassatus]
MIGRLDEKSRSHYFPTTLAESWTKSEGIESEGDAVTETKKSIYTYPTKCIEDQYMSPYPGGFPRPPYTLEDEAPNMEVERKGEICNIEELCSDLKVIGSECNFVEESPYPGGFPRAPYDVDAKEQETLQRDQRLYEAYPLEAKVRLLRKLCEGYLHEAKENM